jgi:hypothetical protein
MRLLGATFEDVAILKEVRVNFAFLAPSPSAAARTAECACRDRNKMDSTAFCCAKALTKRPTMMCVTSKALVSKKSLVESGLPRTRKPKETSEKMYAALELKTMSKSISTMRAKTSALGTLT